MMDVKTRSATYRIIKTLVGNTLTPLEAKVLSMRYDGLCYVDMAKRMNKTRKYKIGLKEIDNALCRVMRKIREIEIDIGEFFDDDF